MNEEPSDAQCSGPASPPRPSPAGTSSLEAPTASPAPVPDPSSPTAPDPEDWQSTAASSDDERYLRERPPHWE